MMYLERLNCNLCMGNQEKAEKGDTVMSTSTRLFKGRVVADSNEKKRGITIGLNTCGCTLLNFGRIPSIEEYRKAVSGINLTKFAPPSGLVFLLICYMIKNV